MIIRWACGLTEKDVVSCFISYDQVAPDDPFGKMMISNLAARGSPLLSIHHYPSLEAQRCRFASLGFCDAVSAVDMNFIFDEILTKEDRERVSKLELFDEFEEWRLMQVRFSCVPLLCFPFPP